MNTLPVDLLHILLKQLTYAELVELVEVWPVLEREVIRYVIECREVPLTLATLMTADMRTNFNLPKTYPYFCSICGGFGDRSCKTCKTIWCKTCQKSGDIEICSCGKSCCQLTRCFQKGCKMLCCIDMLSRCCKRAFCHWHCTNLDHCNRCGEYRPRTICPITHLCKACTKVYRHKCSKCGSCCNESDGFWYSTSYVCEMCE